MTSKDGSRESYFPAIEKKYGEPISYWHKVMAELVDQKYPEQIAHLREALSESDLPWAVDIVEWGRCSESFRSIIQAQYQIILPNHTK